MQEQPRSTPAPESYQAALVPENSSASVSGIRDNRARGSVFEFLSDQIRSGSNLSFVSAYFTIYAYWALAAKLDSIKHLRFLFGEPKFISNLDPSKTDKKAFQIEDSEIRLGNRLEQKLIARACAEWIQDKVDIRSIRHSQLLHGKLYHIDTGTTQEAILGSSNFTQRGIGASSSPNIELNIVVDSKRELSDLKAWFDELWNDEGLVEDVKDQVLEYLKQIYVDHAPEFIYFKTLYHIFEKFLLDREEESQRFLNLEIVETEIWKALFDFQRDGVKGAINKINAHNGCILADSVGLGKTYTALAVIKYYELRNQSVLVLCPKKLKDNWTVYQAHTASELNPFRKDRFAYTVLAHTDLSRDGGCSGDIDLANVNWGAFDLIVIDESHNFRNNVRGKKDEEGNVIRKSRYERLMEDILQAGVKTKVLLLSATPVNNDLKDLRNQIYFVTEGRDDAFKDSFAIASIKETLAAAQRVFLNWAQGHDDKDARVLLERLPASFFTLLDELTIARSRKHIKRYYEYSLRQLGGFPERNKPHSIYAEIDANRDFMSYDALSQSIEKYRLSLYNPYRYVLEAHQRTYEHAARNMKQENRERFLIAMMKVNFLKRLESSIESFEITMARTVQKIEDLEERLRRFLDHKLTEAAEVMPEAPEGSILEDEELAGAFEVGKALRYQMEHLDVKKWLKDLEDDRKQLERLRDQAAKVTPDRDAKLAELKKIIRQKIQNPSKNKEGEPIDKVIVFAAFADTADYLYANLEPWARDELGVHIAIVTGGAKESRTTFGKPDFNQILTNFAPRAKNREKMRSMPQGEQISILIATDCISEGQNLQDCDLLVNYDIHWNPVRIIQRFGRIDRIGSLHSEISLVNFWPTPDLNQYINLKNRVEARMALVDISATAEDNLLDLKQLEGLIATDLKYRDKQLLKLQNEILDLEDFREMPSLNEFTLDDFRMELANYIEANKKALRDAPLGLYGVVPVGEEHPWVRPGVIFCLRHLGDTEGTEAVNPIQPYYLVYVHDTGDVRFTFAQPKQVLDLFRDLCLGKAEAIQDLCNAFNRETENGKDMTRYSDLLKKAVEATVSQFTKRSVAGLLSSRGGRLPDASRQFKSVDDFELITWLVIMKDTDRT